VLLVIREGHSTKSYTEVSEYKIGKEVDGMTT